MLRDRGSIIISDAGSLCIPWKVIEYSCNILPVSISGCEIVTYISRILNPSGRRTLARTVDGIG
jgi:hypothetical protein